MLPDDIFRLTADLVAIRSLSGNEEEAQVFLEKVFSGLGWTYERIPVAANRANLFVTFGVPRVLFTTHFDVVPAPESLFQPKVEGSKLTGRGACDAKGIAATMIGVCLQLRERGVLNFGLLLVVGEEQDGIGARTAATHLQGRGIEFIINGEPTEGLLMQAHKGGLGIDITFSGSACHSGYPELGDDANAKLVRLATRLLAEDFGTCPKLGKATINLGLLEGGTQANVVSPRACLSILLRTVKRNESALARIQALAREALTLDVTYNLDPVDLLTVPGFATGVASYCTDIPFFAPLGAQALLYGPGSIHRAHTDFEFITLQEIDSAMSGYHRLVECLIR